MSDKEVDDPIDILRREMGLDDNLESDNVVYKREKIKLNGMDLEIRRVFVLFGSYRVGWVHDADVEHCMACETHFGFFKRKHHCRACGAVICSTCSPYRTHIPSLDGGAHVGQEKEQASRVCNNCFGLKINMITPNAPNNVNEIIHNVTAKRRGSLKSKEDWDGNDHVSSNENDSKSRANRKREKRAEIESLQFQLLETPKYSKAYRKMRGIIPPYIASLNLKSLLETGLPKAVAERVWSKRCLWLIVMHPQDIRKIHIADLRSKYTPIGLDLTERYAVWHNLPDWGEYNNDNLVCRDMDQGIGNINNDTNLDKIEWKSSFKDQMDEMARKYARGELPEDQIRHNAYANHEPIHLFSHRANIQQLYVGDKANYSAITPAAPESVLPSSISHIPPSSNSPDTSECSSQLSNINEDNSPVVPLFVRREVPSTSTGSSISSEAKKYECVDSFSRTLQSSTPTNLLPTLEQQRQRREGRIEERKRRTSRNLQLRSSSLSRIPTVVLVEGNGTSCQNVEALDVDESSNQRLLRKVLSTPIEISYSTSPQFPSSSILPSEDNLNAESSSKSNELFSRPSPSESSERENLHQDVASAKDPLSPSHDNVDVEDLDQVTGMSEEVIETPPTQVRSRRNSRSRKNSLTPSVVGDTLMSSLIESDLPRLTATPLRNLMADNTSTQRKNVIIVMQQMQSSEINLSAEDATELLKYAVVNLMDMRICEEENEGERDDNWDSGCDDVEYENAMLSIIEILICKCEADIDTVDLDGNNLLTFLQESVTIDMIMCSQLVPTLVRLGINILIFKDNEVSGHGVLLDIHPMFVAMSRDDMLQLVTSFSSVSSVNLSQSQKFTYFVLLVVIGRSSIASLVLNERCVKSIMESSNETRIASSLLKICNFDSMEDPLETFELLDKYGASL